VNEMTSDSKSDESRTVVPPVGAGNSDKMETPEGAKTGSTAAESSPGGDALSREQKVREEAYRRYQARGGQPGDPLDDWLEAEAGIDRVDRTGPSDDSR
jgi:hypothetical protein